LAFHGGFAGGELVAVLGEIPLDFVVNGEAVPGSWLALWKNRAEGNWASAGIQLFHRATSGRAQIVGAIGITARVCRAYELFKFRLVPDLARHVVINPSVDSPLVQFRRGADPRAVARLRPRQAALDSRDEGVRAGAPDAATWDTLWTARRCDGVGVDRTWKYMLWRYVDHPHYQYDWHCARSADGDLEGVAVTRAEHVGDEDVLHVLELIGTAPARRRLAAHLCRTMVTMGAPFMGFRCASKTVRDAFSHAGGSLYTLDDPCCEVPSLFQPLVPRYSPLLWGVRSAAGVPAFDLDDCYVTRSDGDQDRPSRIL
jgi:hypothetical protein